MRRNTFRCSSCYPITVLHKYIPTHERRFNHDRRFSNGKAIRSWLRPGYKYIKRHVRYKHDPLVNEAESLEVNLKYPHVHYADGRETTVSISDHAPRHKNLSKKEASRQEINKTNSQDEQNILDQDEESAI